MKSIAPSRAVHTQVPQCLFRMLSQTQGVARMHARMQRNALESAHMHRWVCESLHMPTSSHTHVLPCACRHIDAHGPRARIRAQQHAHARIQSLQGRAGVCKAGRSIVLFFVCASLIFVVFRMTHFLIPTFFSADCPIQCENVCSESVETRCVGA